MSKSEQGSEREISHILVLLLEDRTNVHGFVLPGDY